MPTWWSATTPSPTAIVTTPRSCSISSAGCRPRPTSGALRSISTRTRKNRAPYRSRISFNLQREQRRLRGVDTVAAVTNDVLSSVYSWTRRTVDSITDPRRGDILTLRVGGGLQRSGINDTFLYGYGRYMRYF